ncbi:hypothetical protein EI94DRAFT_1740946 [Lactarius quietus]|nr:hypothetical protein EI94DRAFT_1740946 [Lactarius quietus]
MRMFFHRRLRPPRRLSILLFLTSAALFAAPTTALWPFPPKRFSGNALIGAGSLGLDDGDGRVIAFGDFNGDHFMDVLTLASDQHTLSVYLWSHSIQLFLPSLCFFRHPERIYNVVPGDYTHDGRLDLLVMSQSASPRLSLTIYPAMPAEDMNPIELPPSTLAQPIPFDSDGQMRIDLLGLQPGVAQLSIWKNVWNASEPSDIFLVCDEGGGKKSFQVWVSDPSEGFTLAQRGSLPSALNPDGTIDLLITTCSLVSQSTGLGTNCALNIAYNMQLPLCAASSSFPFTGGPAVKHPAVAPTRSASRLQLHFTFSGPNYVSVPINELCKTGRSSRCSTRDANLDGFPDLLSYRRSRAPLALYTCSRGVPGCSALGVEPLRASRMRAARSILLNGACSSGWCVPQNSSLARYTPSGASNLGASYKYTILDTSGRRSAAQVPQLPQTSYQALNTPYAVLGTTIALAGVVLVLHLNEKREDELERRRSSHHINFDAL